MITRRQLLGWGATAVAAFASVAKAFGRCRLLPEPLPSAQRSGLADELNGKIFYKGDSQYETLRTGSVWNARKPNRFPEAIVMAETDADVIAAVKLAKERGWKIGTRSGGHSFTASHLRDGAVQINLSRMRQLSIDAESRLATVSPSWRGDAFNDRLREYGLVFPAAHCPGVGLGGFIMCGGHSTYSRKYGPACASLQALDVVTADGELIHADESNNSDYLWAARGSGPGFFGVAVRFYLNLYPLPKMRKNAQYTFDVDVIDELFQWFSQIQNSFPPYMEGVLRSQLVEGKPRLYMGGAAYGDSENEIDDALAILETCPVRSRALSRPGSSTAASGAGGGGLILGSRVNVDGVWSSASGEKVLAVARDAFLSFPTPQSFMLWLHWGPVQKLEDMAYSLQGDAYLSPNAVWKDPNDDARCTAWANAIVSKLASISVGSQMNDENMVYNKLPYLSPQAAARLELMRRKYDPDQRFVSFLT